MSTKKQFLKSSDTCKVTFRVTKKDAGNANSIMLVGSFTDWESKGIEMKKLKSGDFTTIVKLPVNSELQYRYIKDGTAWFNDSEADLYVQNDFGESNSVVRTIQ